MTKIKLECGAYFDPDTSTQFREERHHDGRNYISVATGSQWEHQALYRTSRGAWILNCWSAYQGTVETYERIDEAQAVAWLAANCRDDDLPAELRALVDGHIEALEV